MSVSRPVCAALVLTTLAGAFWIPSSPLAASGITSPATSGPAVGDDDQAADSAEAPPFKPVARVSSLMTGIGSAFGSLNDVFPKVDDEHRLDQVVRWSEVIAELSNVNTQHQRRPAGYLEMAADTRSIALELSREARSGTPDEAQLTTLLASLDNSCVVCHEADH